MIKYKLYLELEPIGFHTLYTNTYIPLEKLFTKEVDIEHIIPKAKLFDDSFSNKTLSLRQVNLEKGNSTAYDYLIERYGEGSEEMEQFDLRIEKLMKNKDISRSKFLKLRMKERDIPDGFIERDLRNSQYIAKKARMMLQKVVRIVTPTTGSVTDKLREDWQLINVLQELNWDKYKALGLTTYEKNKDGKDIPKIIDWTKRNDHRHHAMDAITVAFTRPSHIQYLNYQNAKRNTYHEKHSNIFAIQQKETYINDKNKRIIKPPIPPDEFRLEAKKHLSSILVSFKAKNKVVTRNVNRIKTKSGELKSIELTPRGKLHMETVYGKSLSYITKSEKVGPKFDKEKILTVAKKSFRNALLQRLIDFNDDPKKAFGGKNALSKNPLWLDENQSVKVPDKVKTVKLEGRFTMRKDVGPDLKLDKVIDLGIKQILKKRLEKYGGNAKLAFSNLKENPIWLNKEKGIKVKRVTIQGVQKAEPLHFAKDHLGEVILNDNHPIPVDYVQTRNNHHIAIYRDEHGDLHEKVVSFYEAVMLKNQGLSVVDKEYNAHLGWKFLFTMKQNEMFVFPNEESGFLPKEIDLMDDRNLEYISKNLFRVQKLASKNYFFRHHLETDVIERVALKNVAYKPQLGLNGIEGIIKVRLNHLGKIVHIGEY